MNKLYKISLINTLFCTFIMSFIYRIILYTNGWSIVYIFILYTISASLLFIYQRWINKKVLPYLGRSKYNYSILSMTLSHIIIGVIIARVSVILNSFSYIIKLAIVLKSYPSDIDGVLFTIIIFYNITFITLTGMAMNGLLDIKIKDIKRLRWKDK